MNVPMEFGYNQLHDFFDEIKNKDIVCWGSGKHFRNITYSFLKESGLLINLKGFVEDQAAGKFHQANLSAKSSKIIIDDRSYEIMSRENLAKLDRQQTIILVTVAGYKEIIAQIRGDKRLANFEVIPSIYVEALYEDMQMLSANKPPQNFHKNDNPVIPRKIHTFWFSGEEIPAEYKMCLESWRKYAPDFEIKIWDLDSYKAENCEFFEQAIAHKNWAFASDYARVDVLRRYGGVYMDMDVEMLRPIDDLLYNDAYMSFESMGRIECGSGMGAKPGNRIIDEICKSYESRPYLKADGSWDNSTCPVRYTQVIEQHGLEKNGGFQFVEDITIYPFDVLTCKSFDTGIIYYTENSYTIHHHNGNWVPGSAKCAMENRYAEIRDFLLSRGLL